MHMTRFGVVAGMLVTVAAAQASVVISDDFSLTGTGRTAGAAINGTTTPVGNSKWIASTGVTFGGNSTNGDVVFGGASQVAAVVAPTNFGTLQVSMDVHPVFNVTETGTTSGWIAVGMGDSTGSNKWYNGLMLLLQPVTRSNGNWYKYQLFDNGLGYMVAQGDTPIPVADTTMVTLTLAYTASTNSVSAWYDSTAIVTNQSLGSFTPTTDRIGFSSYNLPTDGTGIADNFAVDVTPVPEPASIGLLAVAGLALLSIAKKSRM